MSADNPAEHSSFVTASDLSDSEQKNGRTCRFCGKSYSDDGRARAAYLRHVADCKDDGQTRLFQFALEGGQR